MSHHRLMTAICHPSFSTAVRTQAELTDQEHAGMLEHFFHFFKAYISLKTGMCAICGDVLYCYGSSVCACLPHTKIGLTLTLQQ